VASVAFRLRKDASHLSAEDDSEYETLPQRVFQTLTPHEQELNFHRNEYSMVSEECHFVKQTFSQTSVKCPLE